MKLKTLEDIEIPNRTFTRRILKAEAVKWVKMLQKRIEQGISFDFERSKIEWEAQIEILRIVFNLTEDDLVPIENNRVGTKEEKK